MDNANPAALREMYGDIKFSIDTQEYGLKIQPTFKKDEHPTEWMLQIFSDSNWASYTTNRKSVTGIDRCRKLCLLGGSKGDQVCDPSNGL
jgi:uncharacterized protein YjlB